MVSNTSKSLGARIRADPCRLLGARSGADESILTLGLSAVEYLAFNLHGAQGLQMRHVPCMFHA